MAENDSQLIIKYGDKRPPYSWLCFIWHNECGTEEN